MENATVKNAIVVIIPTGITYISFLNDLKLAKTMEVFIPYIMAAIVCGLMIYIVHRHNQRERYYNAIEANIEKQKKVTEFLLTKLKLKDEFNEYWEFFIDEIKNNKSFARSVIENDDKSVSS